MKKGYLVLEILISVAIGALLTGALAQSLWQLSKSVGTVIGVSSTDIRISIVNNLFEKELAGACVSELISHTEEEKDQQKKSEDPKAQTPEAQKKEKKKPKITLPPKAFYSENDAAGIIKVLTFITTNRINTRSKAKTSLVRIEYTVRQDLHRGNGLYALYREEQNNYKQDYQGPSEAVKGTEVIGGIRSFKVEFFASLLEKKEEKEGDKKDPQKKPNEKEKEIQKAPKKKKEYVPFATWDSDKQEAEKQYPRLPEFIKLTLTLLEKEGKDRTVEWMCAPLYGQEPVIIEGIKPLPDPSKDKKNPEQQEKPGDALSPELQNKFSQFYAP